MTARGLSIGSYGEAVSRLQQDLRQAGYDIAAAEIDRAFLGPATRDAILRYQRDHALPPSGNADPDTLMSLAAGAGPGPVVPGPDATTATRNLTSGAGKPDGRGASRPAGDHGAAVSTTSWVVRGVARDEQGQALAGHPIGVFVRRLRGEQWLADGEVGPQGFYELRYQPPPTALVGEPFLVVVRVFQTDGGGGWESPPTRAIPELLLDVGGVAAPTSDFTRHLAAIRPLLEGVQLADIVENDQHQDVSFLAGETNLHPRDVAHLAMAHRLETAAGLPAELFYGFLRQGLPPSAPDPLLTISSGLVGADPLVGRVVSGIYGLSPSLQHEAIAVAARRGTISRALADQADALVTELQRRRVDDALDQPFMVGKTPLRGLLTVAGLPADKHQAFAQAFLTTRGNSAQFWKDLPGLAHLTVEEAARLRRTLEIGSFTKNSLPVVEAIQARFAAGEFTDVRDLARLTTEDWKQFIAASGTQEQPAVPANIDGMTTDDRIGTYAQEIVDRVTRAYPTTALVSRATRAGLVPQQTTEHLTTLFTNNPQIDLRRTNVAALAAATPSTLEGIPPEARPAVLHQVNVLQRVIRLVPHVDTATVLLAEGIDSATKVYAMGKAQFIERVAGAGASRIEARKTFYRAEQRYAALLSRLMQNNAGFNPDAVAALPKQAPTALQQVQIDQDPTLRTLFGSQDFCACQECNSVLSAAAYLADLLVYLGHRKQTGMFTDALEALHARRPDIVTIFLNCTNTNTELPYIDLVCELLEDAVAPPASPPKRQTSLTPAELRAYPEHVNTAAYDSLAKAAFPHTLPYHTWLDEVRSYLRPVGVDRWQLMRAFADQHDPNRAPTPGQISGEFFGLSARELNLITQPDAVPATEAWNLPDPVTTLGKVSSFLDASGLDYPQLQALLDVVVIRSGGASSALGGVSDTCDTTTQTISHLDQPGRLDRIHRFLRLWRRTGWAMWELDSLLSLPTVGNASLDADALTHLMTFRELQTTLGLAADELAAFFAPIDTADHHDDAFAATTSLYARLFLNRAVTNPPDPALAVAAVTAPAPTEKITAHVPAVLGGLQLSEHDLTRLLPLTDGALSLTNLSLLYRHARLASALGIPVGDLLRLAARAGVDPFASLEATQALVGQAAALKRTGFSFADLDYLLTAGPSPLAPDDDALAAILTRLRAGMQKVHDDFADNGQPPDQLLARRLPLAPGLSDPPTLATALAIATGSFTGTDADRAAFIDTSFAAFVDATTAHTRLGALASDAHDPAARATEVAQRCRFLLDGLAHYATRSQVRQVVASALGMPDDTSTLILNRLHVAGTAVSLLDALSDSTLIDRTPDGKGYLHPLDAVSFPRMFEALRRGHKLGVLLARVRVSRDELAWLMAHAADYGGLDPAALPLLAADPSPTLAALLATTGLVNLARTLTRPAGGTLLDLVAAVAAGSDLPTTIAAIARLGGWDHADVAATATALGLRYPTDYLTVETYQRLRRCLGFVSLTSVGAARLADWAQREPTAQDAAQVRQAIKARYDQAAWLAVAPTLQDPVRERRRHALVDYLVARPPAAAPGWRDANGLFAHFLIDVEMSPCQLTSRIVQAYASIQLFVQRCLMNLEVGITADAVTDDGWRQWASMQRFGLWQADRKIFLCPENYMLEAGRPTTSPFFREFLDELNQGEIASDRVEDAFLHYLDKLHSVAHLDVTGVYDDREHAVLHVVARSKSSPPRFYHRRFVDRRWTAWEKIDLDIKATHVVPVIFRRRLHLFWPVITVRTERDQQIPPADKTPAQTAPKPTRHAEIQIGWSAYRSGKWTPAQTSEGRFFDRPYSPAFNVILEPHHYTLKLIPNSSSITIDLYRHPNIFPSDWLDGSYNIGRATFAGDFSEFQVSDLGVADTSDSFLSHVQDDYGPPGRTVTALTNPDPVIGSPPGLALEAGAMVTTPPTGGLPATGSLDFITGPNTFVHEGPLLNSVPLPFAVVGSDQDLAFDPTVPFFFGDQQRSFFVLPTRYWQHGSSFTPEPPPSVTQTPYEVKYEFTRFYHPYTRLFLQEIDAGGVAGLFRPEVQAAAHKLNPADAFSFPETYRPASGIVKWGDDFDSVDFRPEAGYALYNSEVFLHGPITIAERLSQNQRFEEALRWFHYVFDPTRPGPEAAPQRFWITRPLAELTKPAIQAQRIDKILEAVNAHDKNAEAAVTRWRANPFNPFLIADFRPVAYMKSVVMKYLDALIGWGDQLYRSASREALNEAALLYVLAAEILGPRPQRVPPPLAADQSFADVAEKLDEFTNAMVDVEATIPATETATPTPSGAAALPRVQTFLFKIPPNDKLLSYWDTVGDRLFKLRHCQTIEGAPLKLALFDPPIDPGLLVKAAAAGVDVGSLLADSGAPLPHHRFGVMYAKALEMCNELRSFGAALLAALEKRDAEHLAQLRSSQELAVLAAARDVRQAALDEATKQLDVLNHSRALAEGRKEYYSSRPYMNVLETASVALSTVATLTHSGGIGADALAGVVYIIPQFNVGISGFGGTPHAGASEGGANLGGAASRGANSLYQLAALIDKSASLASVQGSYQRRADDWAHQADQATKEIAQIDAQIAAAAIRQSMAQKELDNHDLTITNAKTTDEFLNTKFTNMELYDYMVGQLSTTYFQNYQLAFDLARRAERCYRYELGLPEASFVSFGYWDSLRKGLLAGERLSYDLRRMDASYLDADRRRLELTRHVSLAEIDPTALLTLIHTGSCLVEVPEALFDLDYPGHYQRRLKAVSVTIPCVTGPYTAINCTLTMVSNSIRMTAAIGDKYPRKLAPASDPRFLDQLAAVQTVATSSARDDPCVFEPIGGDRYLPFEGAGAVSHWKIDLPADTNNFDRTTVSDVILHLRYTALDGGDDLRTAARAAVIDVPRPGTRVFSAKHDFPDAWYQLLHPPTTGADQQLVLALSPDRFPYATRGKRVDIGRIEVFAASQQSQRFVAAIDPILPNATPMERVATFGDLYYVAVTPTQHAAPGTWTIRLRLETAADFHSLTAADLDDVVLAVHYTAAA